MSELLDQAGKSRRLAAAQSVTLVVLGVVMVVAGCGKQDELRTEYGHRRGSAGASVNGTRILSAMFREAGTRPKTIVSLSSHLDKYDVVVWAPDDFHVPDEDTREFFEKWLTEVTGRTLVYIGRDYDASCDYWPAVVSQTPAPQQRDVMVRGAESRAAHSSARLSMPVEGECEWFMMRRDFAGQQVGKLGGPWSIGLDYTRTQIWSQGRLDVPTPKELDNLWKSSPPALNWQPEYTPLLISGEKTLVYEVSKQGWGSSRILVVANGSFLLNLPLVNHQHRQLAGRLIAECQPCSEVAFLESQAGGPFVSSYRHVDESSVRMRVLLAAHWFVLGAVYCFYVFPIFGRPRSIETNDIAGFGQHVDAMASLLAHSKDVGYARRQLDAYYKGYRIERPNDAPKADLFGAAGGKKDST